MTISEMTNEQLDRMIAEKRGWECIYCECGCDRFHWITPDGSRDELPSFTTDPRYAIELLKELPDPSLTHYEGDFWYASYLTSAVCENTSCADTPERAIAEAWMEWVK